MVEHVLHDLPDHIHDHPRKPYSLPVEPQYTYHFVLNLFLFVSTATLTIAPPRRIVYGAIADLQQRTAEAGLRSPTLLIIGDVVALSPGWEGWLAAGRPTEWNEASTCVRVACGVFVRMWWSNRCLCVHALVHVHAYSVACNSRVCVCVRGACFCMCVSASGWVTL